jgi:hypothetical protein
MYRSNLIYTTPFVLKYKIFQPFSDTHASRYILVCMFTYFASNIHTKTYPDTYVLEKR